MISRRQVLRAGGVLVTAVVVERVSGPLALTAQSGGSTPGVPDAVLDLIRSDIQLRCSIELHGLEVVGNELVAIAGATRHRIVFVLGSQHIDDEIPRSGVYGTDPVAFRSARPSRLAFDITPPVAFDLDTLLDWQDLVLALDGRAAKDEGTAVDLTDPPADDVTAIELHEGLVLSPIPTDGLFGEDVPQARLQADPQTFGEASITWQATIVGSGLQALPSAPSLRAIWTPGYQPGTVPAGEIEPYTRALTALDRRRIVQATGDWSQTALDAYPAHEPVEAADAIVLSPAGATASLSGAWSGPGALAAWLHDITLGRTIRATVVQKGFLLPFGNPASITTTTIRTFSVDTEGTVVSGLSTVQRLEIPRSTVTPDLDSQPHDGRGWPFRTVTLNPPETIPVGRGTINGERAERVFLLQDEDGLANEEGEPARLQFDAVDRLGKPVTFDCPVVFVTDDAAFEPDQIPLASVLAWSTYGPQKDLFTLTLDGQPVGMADAPEPELEGQVTKQVTSLSFTLQAPKPGITPADLAEIGQVGGFPQMTEAVVTDPVVDSLRGTAEAQVVVPHPDWLELGFDPANIGGSYLAMPERIDLGYQGGGGSLASPELTVDEYNLDLGISAPLDDLAAGWNPLENLQLTSKLFGAIPLSWILPDSIDFDVDLGDQPGIPGIQIDLIGDPVPTSAIFALCWEPPLQTLSIGDTPTFVVTNNLPDTANDLQDPFTGPTACLFKVTQTVSFDDAGDGDAVLEVVIQNVLVQLPPAFPLVQVYVEEVSLTASASEGETLDVNITDVAFTGILNFLDVFQDLLSGVLGLLPGNGADDPTIELYSSIQSPAFNLGVFEMSPFTVTTRLSLPRDDDAVTTVELDIGGSSNFSFMVYGLGGSGRFHIIAAPHPDGITLLYAELAGTVEISVGVLIAKAYASITFGGSVLYEKLTEPNPKTGEDDTFDTYTVEIFLRLTAGLDVLGIISLSGSVELSLSYNINLRLFTGAVTLELAVDYLIGESSKSVTFEESFRVGELATGGTTRQLGPPAGQPGFAERYSQDEWLEYCGSFA